MLQGSQVCSALQPPKAALVWPTATPSAALGQLACGQGGFAAPNPQKKLIFGPKSIMRIFSLFCLLFSLCACQQKATVHSEFGQYSLQFPAPFDSLEQNGVEAYFYKSPDSIWEYQAACMKLGEAQLALAPDSLFEILLLGAAVRLQPMNIQREEGPWGKNSKRYTLMGFDAAAVYDLYRKENKVYHLLIVNHQPQAVKASEIQGFMGSFALK